MVKTTKGLHKSDIDPVYTVKWNSLRKYLDVHLTFTFKSTYKFKIFTIVSKSDIIHANDSNFLRKLSY